MLVVSLVLLVSIIPFVLLGDRFEAQLQNWLSGQTHWREVALGVVVLLGADMVLPVPSSGVSTLAGARLGIFWATAASWLGMTIGSVSGFALARWFGEPLVRRTAGADDLNRLTSVANAYGAMTIALTRPVPILAEAAVLLLGATRLAWKRFLPVTLLSNFAIALMYSTLGSLSYERGQLAFALAASVGLPVLATLIARRWLPSAAPLDPSNESP
jgi:uncharacterized membrane protein YdjX (TVP38/TMEM64 family)